jgi:hypothetical protein
MSKRFKLFWAGMALIIFGIVIVSWQTLSGAIAILLGLFVIEPLGYMPINIDWTWLEIFLGLLACAASSLALGFLIELVF